MIFTTKYHAEFSGEGIEYSWGVAKSVYRALKIEDKKGLSNFKDNVEKCLSSEDVLTKEVVRRVSKKPVNTLWYIII